MVDIVDRVLAFTFCLPRDDSDDDCNDDNNDDNDDDDNDDDEDNDPQWKCVSLQGGRSWVRSTIMVREGLPFCHFTSSSV